MRVSFLSAIMTAGAFFGAVLPMANAQQALGSGDPTVLLDGIPNDFISSGPLHRVLLEKSSAAYRIVEEMNAATYVEDYASFVIALVDESKLGGREGLLALGALRDDLGLIAANGYHLDGNDPRQIARTLASIPLELRQTTQPPADGQSRLFIVQFQGPVKDEWLAALEAASAHLVTYFPNNGYVVKVGPIGNAALQTVKNLPFVLGVHAYEPAFKMRPELRPPYLNESGSYDITIQVIADADGKQFVDSLPSIGLAVLRPPVSVLDTYINVDLRVSGRDMLELAKDARVFAVEPILEARKLDERQGQIQAGQLNAAGTQPSGPNYFAWLAGKGFPGAGQNPFDFVVDVVDDGVDKGNTTQINNEFRVDGSAAGASRVAYAFNYTSDATADGVAGHGNINASIIGGYNNLTGTAYEDTAFYNYGLGIAPWVKVGNSKVFANSGAGQFNQPTATRLANAYNGGARISSNSWGFTSGTTYNTDSQAHDIAVRDAVSATAGNQELSIVFAAGNDGSGASTIHPPGTAKNIITVGASENYRMTGSDGCGITNTGADNALDMATFSSRGPCSDGRKKPDLVSVGTHVEGAASQATGYNGTGVCNQYWPTGQTLYAWSSGTSHSTPAVAGAAALVRRYCELNGLGTPSPAMVKAYLMNGTTYMSGVGANDTLYSNNQGMGRVNLERTFDASSRIRVDQSQVLGASGQTYTVSGNISSSSVPFRVTLAWTDAAGATTGNAWVNNLDLEVTVNGTLYRGNVFSGANSISGGTADASNNVESVFLPAGTTGSFSITVRGTNIAGDGVRNNADTTDQDFALLVYNGSAGTPVPDYSVSATPSSQSITVGGSTSYTVNVAGINGYAGTVGLSVAPAISGVTFGFSPASVAGSGSSTLSVTSTAAAATGTFNLTITGNDGTNSRTTNVSLTLNPVATGNGVKTYSTTANAAIPDNNATGVTSTRNVPDAQTITSVSVSTVITHTYKGDLVVTLIGPDGTSAILHNRTGGSTDNVSTTFAIATTPTQALSVFNGKSTAGNWQLKVQDLASTDTGTLNSWSITFNGEKTATPNVAIPDNNATGVTSTQNFTQTGLVASVKVRTTITHTYKGDLVVTLIAPDGTSAILHNRTGGSTDNVSTEFPDLTASAQSLAVFNGKQIQGNWSLKVQDLASTDTGTLANWTISLTAQ